MWFLRFFCKKLKYEKIMLFHSLGQCVVPTAEFKNYFYLRMFFDSLRGELIMKELFDGKNIPSHFYNINVKYWKTCKNWLKSG